MSRAKWDRWAGRREREALSPCDLLGLVGSLCSCSVRKKKDPTFPPSGAPSKFIPRKSRECTRRTQICVQVAVDGDAVAEVVTRVYMHLSSYLLRVHTFYYYTHHSG